MIRCLRLLAPALLMLVWAGVLALGADSKATLPGFALLAATVVVQGREVRHTIRRWFD